MKNFILFITTIFFTFSLSAQKNLKKADRAYISGDMYKAMNFYASAIENNESGEDDDLKIKVYYRYADALRQMFHFDDAVLNFEKVSNSVYKVNYPLLDYYLGTCLKQLVQYDSAKACFQNFLKLDTSITKQFKRFAEQEVLSCDFAKDLLKSQIENYTVKRLSDNVNTKFADFAPHLVGDFLYYSSMRFESMSERRRHVGDPNKKYLYSKIMTSEVKGLAKGVQLNSLNHPYKNVGNSSLSLDGKRLYLAKGKYRRAANWNIVAKLYVSEFNENRQKWKRPKLLPFNTREIATTTQPHVSFDSTELSEVIYFSSTRKGGFGGFDIWKVYHYGSGKYSDPINLGEPVNSIGDEMTPHFYQSEQKLYFSSNWHLNLGGYDIFYSKENNAAWSIPLNLGIPVNGAANDLYYYISPSDKNLGYITSNRVGSNILIGKACCNDIYQMGIPDSIIYIRQADSVQVIDSNLIANNKNDKTDQNVPANNVENILENPDYVIVPPKYNSEDNPYILPKASPIDTSTGKPYPIGSPVYNAFEKIDKIADLGKDRKLYWDNGTLKPLIKSNPLFAIVPESYNSEENSYTLPNIIPNDPKTGQPYKYGSPEYSAFVQANLLAANSKDRKLYWKNDELLKVNQSDTSSVAKAYLYKIQVAAHKNLKPKDFKFLSEGNFSDYKIIYEKISGQVTRVLLIPKNINSKGSFGFISKEEALSTLKIVISNSNFKDAFIGYYLDDKRVEGLLLRN
jgi:tetratricopeptide (TPR) repeat protein